MTHYESYFASKISLVPGPLRDTCPESPPRFPFSMTSAVVYGVYNVLEIPKNRVYYKYAIGASLSE